ncbi:MAG: hypothetical protein IH899_03160 [Planctomycetes bacterium]|nr:hypothetical protein [Planctomycetota bacterium]
MAGIDLNRIRMRAVLTAVLALSSHLRGFRAGHLAARVQEILTQPYTVRQASYDLKKLRGKGLVERLEGTRRYQSPADALRTIMAVVLLRERVSAPLLAGSTTRRCTSDPPTTNPLEHHYQTLRNDRQQLLQKIGLAA